MPDAQPVLDASALLAYLGNEPGADIVADAIATGATISTVNLGEALSTLAARGSDPADVASGLTDRGLLDGAIAIEPFTTADAIKVARLAPAHRLSRALTRSSRMPCARGPAFHPSPDRRSGLDRAQA